MTNYNIDQQPKKIDEFARGDIITRIEMSAGLPTGIGIAYEKIGILNGQIILKYAQDWDRYKKGDLVGNIFPYAQCQDGWAKYIDPKVLLEDKPLKKQELEEKLKDNLN